MKSALFFLLGLFISLSTCVIIRQKRGYDEFAEAQHTRSLAGTRATDGNNVTNAQVLCLLKVGLLDGYAIRKVKQFNDRVYLSRYRRSYWLGSRYYYLDNRYYIDSRDTCAYRMNPVESAGLFYEDEIPIVDVIFQCQRFAQYCCGLDCCEPNTIRGPNLGYKNVNNDGMSSCVGV